MPMRAGQPIVAKCSWRRRDGVIKRTDVGPRAFEKLAFGERAEGVVAVAKAPTVGLDGLRPASDPLIVVLEGVEKPGNLGAILRSADGARADALIVAGGGTDLFNPNAIRASVGTIFHVPVAAAPTADVWTGSARTEDPDRGGARGRGRRAYGGVARTGSRSTLGSEAGGLSDAWSGDDIEAREPCRWHGVADSLNVSVAAAVLLYEARRQRDDRR